MYCTGDAKTKQNKQTKKKNRQYIQLMPESKEQEKVMQNTASPEGV